MIKTKQVIKSFLWRILPISLRKIIAIGICRGKWLPSNKRSRWSQEILKDWAEEDINAYHNFLWKHHLAYAETYRPELRFGQANLKGSREIFFNDLSNVLFHNQIYPATDVNSIFEVGCSLGYQLVHLEENVFPNSKILHGFDIDEHAINVGKRYLEKLSSRVKIFTGDMNNIEEILHGKNYDIIICTGVLMYLSEVDASYVVKTILRHANLLVAISGLANPDIDNNKLEHSLFREHDKSLIHNIDKMITNAGGEIIKRRWGGRHLVDGNSIYFLFCRKLD